MAPRFLLFLILLLPSTVSAQVRYPKPTGPVNDFAGVIPAPQARQMDAVCRELYQKTGAALVVATVQDLQGLDVETYATELFKQWGIGRKDKDDGVLILLAVSERKVRVEVGYGLEAILPDGKVGRILDQYVMPDLRRDDFGSGLLKGTAAIATTIAENAGVTLTGMGPAAPQQPESSRRSRGVGFIPIVIFIILMIVTRGRILPWLLFFMMMGSGRGGGGGGFGGGGFGGGFGGFGGGASGGGGASRGF